MRRFRALGFVVCGLALHALGQSPTAGAPASPTIASAVDREISGAERQLFEAAEAMQEDRFNFSPKSLKIPGKHVAASNYFLFASVTGEKIPDARSSSARAGASWPPHRSGPAQRAVRT